MTRVTCDFCSEPLTPEQPGIQMGEGRRMHVRCGMRSESGEMPPRQSSSGGLWQTLPTTFKRGTTRADFMRQVLAAQGIKVGPPPSVACVPQTRPKEDPMKCIDCKKSVVGPQAWHEIMGFERDRSAGGTNAVALRRRTGTVKCDDCMRREKRGISRGQGQLG